MRFKIESVKPQTRKSPTSPTRQRYAARLATVLAVVVMASGCNAPRTTVDVESPPSSLPSATTTTSSDSSTPLSTDNADTQDSAESTPIPLSILTGVIIATDEREPCQTAGACGPEFSLYSEMFDERVVLTGNIDASYNGLIVTVTGEPTEMQVQQAGNVGVTDTLFGLNVVSVEAVSKIAYQSFLVKMADEFTEKTFGCRILWDRGFSWKVENDAPQLRVRMSEFNNNGPSGRWIEVWYNGRDGEFIRFISQPSDLNPCL